VTANPHSAGSCRDSGEHEESTEMSGCNLLVVHEQCQGASLHRDGELVCACIDFIGANKVRALVSINDIKVGSSVIKS
jgi:hypothetical protein